MIEVQHQFADVKHEVQIISNKLHGRVKVLQRISGCSNDNFIVEIDQIKFLLRRYQKKDELIMRNQDQEIEVLQFLIQNKCSVITEQLVDFSSFYITKYIEGDLLLQDVDLGNAKWLPLITQSLKVLHSYQINQNSELFHYLDIFYDNSSYYNLTETQLKQLFGDLQQKILQEAIQQPNLLKICICHNDAHAGNIIFSNNKAYFIDFEYASTNYNFYDIACFFAEFTGIEAIENDYPTLETRTFFYQHYFNQGVDINECEKILSLFQPFVWGLWSLWGAKAGFNIYAKNRLNVFQKYIKELK